MAVTPSSFKSAFPEFSGTADSDIQRQIDLFALMYRGDYGDLSDHLAGLYVAHQVTVFTTNTSQAPVQTVRSRSVDGMSWGYSESSESQNAGNFASTKYGLEFYRLMSMFGQGPVMAQAYPQ